jgi:hypothetical protein
MSKKNTHIATCHPHIPDKTEKLGKTANFLHGFDELRNNNNIIYLFII